MEDRPQLKLGHVGRRKEQEVNSLFTEMKSNNHQSSIWNCIYIYIYIFGAVHKTKD